VRAVRLQEQPTQRDDTAAQRLLQSLCLCIGYKPGDADVKLREGAEEGGGMFSVTGVAVEMNLEVGAQGFCNPAQQESKHVILSLRAMEYNRERFFKRLRKR
jgi:hypothetical protein